MSSIITAEEPRRLLDRLLSPFAEVHAGEGANALLLALNLFLILTAYYVLKTVREALILSQQTAEMKSYLAGGMVLVLSFLIPIYGLLVARLSRRRLLNVVTGFFTLCLVVFYFLGKTGGVRLGISFYIWIGIFNMMFVAQFWGFANDIYTKKEGERLFPIIGFGASLGAVLGARLAALLIQPFGILELLLVGAVLLVLQSGITNWVDYRAVQAKGSPKTIHPSSAPQNRPPKQSNAFGMVWGSPYLLLMAFALLLLNWVNTTGEYILGKTIREAANVAVAAGQSGGMDVSQFIGAAYANYFTYFNLLGVLLQLFVVSRIVKYLGVSIAVAILPCISLFSYGIIAFYPVLSIILMAKVAENATDYSLNNTVRAMLFLPLSTEEKFSAKQVIDSFFVRTGDVLAGIMVFVGLHFFLLSTQGFVVMNGVLVIIWMVLAISVGRRYRRLTAETSVVKN
jgi:AAA family ATP:ADP antiporter